MNNIPRKKILYLITKSTWGGAGRYVYDFATNLSKENFEVVVALGGSGELKNKLDAQYIRTISMSSLQRDVTLCGEIKTFFELVKILRKEKPDILHTNSSKAGALGALAGRLTCTPKIIFTAHGWAFNEERSSLSRAVITLVHWLAIMLSHKTIAVSHKTKEQVLKKMPFIKRKIVVVHNGITEISFKDRFSARAKIFPNGVPASPAFAKLQRDKPKQNGGGSKNVRDDTLWFGTISELHKNKGLDYIIRAIGQISTRRRKAVARQESPRSNLVVKKPFVFVIISGGEEKARLAELIAKEKLQNTVFLVGYKKDAASLLKALDAFTLTSRTEAFPYVLLEAGLAELPVIASSVGGVPEIISKDCGILVKAGNIDEIAHAIVQLLKNERVRKDLGTNLKKYVLQNFSTQRMVKKTLQYYN